MYIFTGVLSFLVFRLDAQLVPRRGLPMTRYAALKIISSLQMLILLIRLKNNRPHS